MRSLTFKLVIAFVFVTLVAAGILGFMVNRATTAEFGQYLEYGGPDLERAKNALETYYDHNGGWANTQSAIRVLSGLEGDRLILTDGNGLILADSAGNYFLGRAVQEDSLGMAVPIRSNDRIVGVLHALPDPSRRGVGGMMGRMMGGLVREVAGASEQRFLDALNDSLWWAAATAGVVALVLSLFLARQIVSPLRGVTRAAKRIASGDLSQRVKVSSGDEIGQLAAAFNTMADNLAHTEQLRRNLVADIAHELRTPLSVIQGRLEAMLDGVVEINPQQIASVHEETLLLSRLVADLRELTLAEAGQLHLHRQPTQLNELLQRAVARLEQTAREREISVVAEVPAALPEVSIDADRVTQVVSNLLSNSIRYSSPGGTVWVKAEEAKGRTDGAKGRLHLGRENGHGSTNGHLDGLEPMVVVSVADEGVGIPSEDLPHVFDRFYRVDRSRTRTSGGSGLGLAIVKEIVEAHGGTVWAESEQGKGSTFRFSLPLNEVKAN